MPEFSFPIIDPHAHPGYERKGIDARPGCLENWLGTSHDRERVQGMSRAMAMAIGFPDPGPMNKSVDLPDFTVGHWIEFMDRIGISHMGLQAMDTESDPPISFRWLVPYEYVKEEFLDRHPERFWGIAGIHYKLGAKNAVKQIERAKRLGFIGIKMFPPYEGYPNDRKLCYPVYEKCLQYGMHVEIHTGNEGMPGARYKYCDPVCINDIAVDFPELRIVQLHCGMGMNPESAIWNCRFHENVYTDISGFLVRHNPKYAHYADLIRLMEELIPNKVWFASDFPVWAMTYEDTLRQIKNLPISLEFQFKLLRENAERFYLKRK